jgi:hypothetical protein
MMSVRMSNVRATAAWLLLGSTVLVMGRVPLRGAGQVPTGLNAADAAEADRLLKGTIDIHVHTLPDSAARSVDGIEAAKQAKAKGMRAIVLKNHYDATAGLAYLARKEAPGIEIFGGVDLDLPTGGMNTFAVEHMTEVSGGFGRVVWMSTFDAENMARYEKKDRPVVHVAKNGELLPETKAVIATIAKHKLVLATGHVSPAEGLLLLREGHRQGVEHMVVTHPLNLPVFMSVEEMQEAAKIDGVFLEFVGGSMVLPDAKKITDKVAETIRKVGIEHSILSSDLGQKANPLPAEGFGQYLLELKRRGFTDQELDVMSRKNPARLLGLPVQ